jgi:hypothetical protein
MAMANAWYRSHYEWLRYTHDQVIVLPERFLSFELHVIAADATNTKVALGVKAHVCKIVSCFRHVDWQPPQPRVETELAGVKKEEHRTPCDKQQSAGIRHV